jgi:hypothetical protein
MVGHRPVGPNIAGRIAEFGFVSPVLIRQQPTMMRGIVVSRPGRRYVGIEFRLILGRLNCRAGTINLVNKARNIT